MNVTATTTLRDGGIFRSGSAAAKDSPNFICLDDANCPGASITLYLTDKDFLHLYETMRVYIEKENVNKL